MYKKNLPRQTLSTIVTISGVMSLLIALLAIFVPSFQRLILYILFGILIIFFLVLILKSNIAFDDRKILYKIEILNNNGDARIQRDTTFVNGSSLPISARFHDVWCDKSSTDLKTLNLKAWDSKNHILQIKVTKDKPNRKDFIIEFSRSIPRNTFYSYSYSLFWPGFFSVQGDYLDSADVCSIVEFMVRLNKGIRLSQLIGKEYSPGGIITDCEEIERKENSINNEYYLKIVKSKRFNKVRLLITFS